MKNKSTIFLFLVFFIICILLQLFTLWKKPPQMAEGWFSDIAYNFNSQLNGKMARDIPWGAEWSSGIGRSFFIIHHFFYKFFGVGVFQARMVSFLAGYLFLFFIFRWASKEISLDVAFFSIALLCASPSWWTFLANARQDVLHCLFAFISFYLVSRGEHLKKYIYIFAAGFIAALSVEIDYRGIEIVICTYLFCLFYCEKDLFIKRSFAFILGGFIGFVIWFFLKVVPMGFANFIQYNLMPSMRDGGPYSFYSIFSEFIRFVQYSDIAAHLAKIEIVLWIFLCIIFYRFRARYKQASSFILRWLFISFITMSFLERSTYPVHMLKYSPFICMLGGIGLGELFTRKRKFAWGIFIFILFFGLIAQTARAGKYFYHEYIKRDYNPKVFFKKLRDSVNLDKNIIGDINNWYAFKDTQYYGGSLYLGRVQRILRQLKSAEAYENDLERAKALLDVFRERKIAYVIAPPYFKYYIAQYFPNQILPENNFRLVATAQDYFLGSSDSAVGPIKSEVYKIISYNP